MLTTAWNAWVSLAHTSIDLTSTQVAVVLNQVHNEQWDEMMRVQSSEQSYPHSARDVAVVLQYRTGETYILRMVADGQINCGRKSASRYII